MLTNKLAIEFFAKKVYLAELLLGCHGLVDFLEFDPDESVAFYIDVYFDYLSVLGTLFVYIFLDFSQKVGVLNLLPREHVENNNEVGRNIADLRHGLLIMNE